MAASAASFTSSQEEEIKNVDALSLKIKQGPPTAALFVNRAEAFEKLGLLDKALEDLRTAATIDNSAKLQDEIKSLLLRAAKQRSKAEEQNSLPGLLAAISNEAEDTADQRLEAASKLAVLSKDEGVARRIVVEGGLPQLFAAIQKSSEASIEPTSASAKLILEIVAVLRNSAQIKENSKDLLDSLDQQLIFSLVPLNNIQLATKSLDFFAALVHQSGLGWQSEVLDNLRQLLVDCLKVGTKDDLRLAVANTILRSAGDESSCFFLVQGPIYSLIFQLCSESNEKLRNIVPLLLSRLFENLQGEKEEAARRVTRDLISRWLNSNPQEKTLSLLALAAVFNARSSYGSSILLSPGIMDEIMDIVEYESESVQTATVEVLSNACADQECRKKIASRCVPFLTSMARSQTSTKLRTMASGALIKIMFADRALESKMLEDNRLAKSFIATLKSDGADSQLKLHAVEALAYLSLRPVTKELIVDDPKLLKALISLAKSEDRATQYGVISILSNLTIQRRRLTEEEQQLQKLKEVSGDSSGKPDPLDNDDRVERRVAKVISAGACSALVSAASAASTAGLAEVTAQVFVNLANDKKYRGRLVQEGAVKALIGLTDKKSPDNAPVSASATKAAHALAKIAITTDPNVAFKGERAAELVRPLVALCNGQDALQQFEALLALTNLASFDDDVRTRIVLAKGVKAMEFLQFSDNDLIRRAATEALCNMMFEPTVFQSYANSTAPGRLRMMLALCDVEDLETRRAATGALAILSSDQNACRLMVEETRGLEVLMGTIFGEENPEILHRGVECVKNIAAVGGKLAQQLEAAGAVPALRLLVRNPNQEVAVGAIEGLQNLQKAGVNVLSKKIIQQ
ncbi:armadillo-type protein [Zopfochytrium polystomum]|nr:armadillo-type protein [Zopfochytrium polystomum]